ncbi:putative acetyltransferase [Yoonia tamlensis]|uniref:Putative acetyltransferase n=1 Tax=Yoonia tamlensis TaxID=390270 RepID=A0A1I6FR66_9RHOB|nr:N-acetyltransferase [Yoonia tamlensis]SFR32386.1 putative acetyltransferase [Yoonia tamlensis]
MRFCQRWTPPFATDNVARMNLFQSPEFARDMKHGEEAAVDALLTQSFGSPAEAQLVAKLRKARVIAGETVLPMGGRIIGYYALSYLVKPKGWLCLAPVAIHSDVQGRGYGRRMLGVLTEWARLTKTPVVVLGNPDFYARAGFSHELAKNLQSPYPIKNTLVAGIDQAPAQTLVYPAAFTQ